MSKRYTTSKMRENLLFLLLSAPSIFVLMYVGSRKPNLYPLPPDAKAICVICKQPATRSTIDLRGYGTVHYLAGELQYYCNRHYGGDASPENFMTAIFAAFGVFLLWVLILGVLRKVFFPHKLKNQKFFTER